MGFSDHELVEEIRSGSSVAFEQLMRRYSRLVHRVAYGFTADSEGAMDIMQETFLKVHGRLNSWRGHGELKNWIARIAANEAMNWNRSRRRHPTVDLDEAVFPEPDPPQEEALLRREARDSLHHSLLALSPRQRLAIVLRYFQGMSTRQISSVLDCTEGTARNTLFRGLQKLRAILTDPKETLP